MIPKNMERGAWRVVMICLALVVIGTIIGLLWMNTYSMK